MTRDDIIRWARESGGLPDPMVFYAGYERFANLVAAAEREECAKLCESEYNNWDNERPLRICAQAIRMRGDK